MQTWKHWGGDSGSRWQRGGTLNSPPLTDTLNLQLHREQLLKKNLKTMWATPVHLVNERRPTSKEVGEAGAQFCHKLYLGRRGPIIGRERKTWSFSLRSKGCEPHQALRLLRSAPESERWAPKTFSFANQWGSPPWDSRAANTWEMALKRARVLVLTAQGSVPCRGGQAEVPRPGVNEAHLLILRPAPEGQVSKLAHI